MILFSKGDEVPIRLGEHWTTRDLAIRELVKEESPFTYRLHYYTNSYDGDEEYVRSVDYDTRKEAESRLADLKNSLRTHFDESALNEWFEKSLYAGVNPTGFEYKYFAKADITADDLMAKFKLGYGDEMTYKLLGEMNLESIRDFYFTVEEEQFTHTKVTVRRKR